MIQAGPLKKKKKKSRRGFFRVIVEEWERPCGKVDWFADKLGGSGWKDIIRTVNIPEVFLRCQAVLVKA